MKTKALLFALLFFVSVHTYSQISFKTEYFGPSSYWLDKGDDPREKVGDAKGSAMVYQGTINIPLSVKMDKNDKPVVWGIGVAGAYASLSNHRFTENLVISEIMNIGFGIYHLRPLHRKWSLMASLGAGIYSPSTDFSEIRFKQILGSISAIFVHHFSSNFDFGGGVALNSTFGYPMVFPAIYLNWHSQGKFDCKISMVNGLEISAGLNVHKYLTLSLIGEMDGQTALLEKDGKDVIFSHQYIVTGVRPEIKISQKVSIPLTAGINAVRPAFFSDRTLKAMFASDRNYYFQLSPYLSAGLTINL